MPFVPVANTCQVELVYNMFQQTCVNTMYFRRTLGWDAVTLEMIANEVGLWWNEAMAANISDSCTLTIVRARDISEVDSYVVEVTYSDVGDKVSPGLPLNATMAVKFGSGLAGRKNRGRNFIVGLTEADVVGNEVVAGTVTGIIEAYESLAIYSSEVDAAHVVVSRTTNPGTAQNVISYSADGFVDSQRRRLSGRGS